MRLLALLLVFGCASPPMEAPRDAAPETREAPSDPIPETPETIDTALPICDIRQVTDSITCVGLRLDGYACMMNCSLPECLLFIPTVPVAWRCVAECSECGP